VCLSGFHNLTKTGVARGFSRLCIGRSIAPPDEVIVVDRPFNGWLGF